jgi:hypothetical protein
VTDLIMLKFADADGAHQAPGAVRALEERRGTWVDDVTSKLTGRTEDAIAGAAR